jgi:hypothetical protein
MAASLLLGLEGMQKAQLRGDAVDAGELTRWLVSFALLCLAGTRQQAQIILNYIRDYFVSVPLLAAMVVGEMTKEGFSLNSGIDIRVGTNSFKGVRGTRSSSPSSTRSRSGQRRTAPVLLTNHTPRSSPACLASRRPAAGSSASALRTERPVCCLGNSRSLAL